MRISKHLRLVVAFSVTLSAALIARAQSPTQLDVANAPIPTHVLVQSPADTQAPLQIICLFHSDSAKRRRNNW